MFRCRQWTRENNILQGGTDRVDRTCCATRFVREDSRRRVGHAAGGDPGGDHRRLGDPAGSQPLRLDRPPPLTFSLLSGPDDVKACSTWQLASAHRRAGGCCSDRPMIVPSSAAAKQTPVSAAPVRSSATITSCGMRRYPRPARCRHCARAPSAAPRRSRPAGSIPPRYLFRRYRRRCHGRPRCG